MIHPEGLINIGFERFTWNNAIPEYWKSYKSGKPEAWDYRIGVRYNEHKNEPCNVWLFVGSNMLKLEHIQTIAQIKTLYGLLAGTDQK